MEIHWHRAKVKEVMHQPAKMLLWDSFHYSIINAIKPPPSSYHRRGGPPLRIDHGLQILISHRGRFNFLITLII